MKSIFMSPLLPACVEGDDMGLQLYHAIRKQPMARATKTVLVHYALCADETTHLAWPRHDDIIECTGLSRRSIVSAIQWLQKAGYLIPEPGRLGRTHRTKVYRVSPGKGASDTRNSATVAPLNSAVAAPLNSAVAASNSAVVAHGKPLKTNKEVHTHSSSNNPRARPRESVRADARVCVRDEKSLSKKRYKSLQDEQREHLEQLRAEREAAQGHVEKEIEGERVDDATALPWWPGSF